MDLVSIKVNVIGIKLIIPWTAGMDNGYAERMHYVVAVQVDLVMVTKNITEDFMVVMIKDNILWMVNNYNG